MTTNDTSQHALLLRPARIVLPDGVLAGASVLVEYGRIARVFAADEATPTQVDQTIELHGLTLSPGFIDVHMHGAVGIDTMTATADELHSVARFLAAAGVTAWLPTLVPAPAADYERAVAAIAQLMREQDARPPAARVLGLHYEGPFINRAQCGALRPSYFRAFRTTEDVTSLPTVADAARMMTIAPEIDGGIALIRELAARDWIVSIGHTRADMQTLDDACAAGARHMTHFFNAMSPLHQRAPGPVGWGLMRDDVTCDLIADGVHTDPLMLQLALRCKTHARLLLISDAVAPTGLGDGDYEIWAERISVINGRTQNGRGSIAGSVSTMRDGARLMTALGVAPHELARMSALNPARLLGVAAGCGSIETGKRADLTALDDAGRVRLTLVGGHVAFVDL